MIYSILKGRIGNNLFQIAAGYTLAVRNNSDFTAYIPDFILPEPDKCTLKKYLEQFNDNLLRKIRFTEHLPNGCEIYHEPEDLSFKEIPFKNELVINGYFQSEKYFDKKLVRDLFSIDKSTAKYIESRYGEILKKGITSINIRRGDFVSRPHLHPVCSMKYFKEAVEYFGRNSDFFVISDDIEWCKRQFKGENYFFIEDEPPAIDLYLQTLCSNNIISNSSFSWWSAWLNLNPVKTVIAPGENWTGKLNPYRNNKDLLPSEWLQFQNPLETRFKVKVLFSKAIMFLVRIKKRLKKILNIGNK